MKHIHLGPIHLIWMVGNWDRPRKYRHLKLGSFHLWDVNKLRIMYSPREKEPAWTRPNGRGSAI